MESDSTLPWLISAISLALFFPASLAEASLASVGHERMLVLAATRVRGSAALEALHATPMGPAGSLTLLKTAFLASGLLSAVALVIALSGVEWGLVSLVSLVTLALFGTAHVISRALAHRFGEAVAIASAPATRQIARVLWPLLALEDRASGWLLRSPVNERETDADTPEAEFAIEANGAPLDEREARMIRGVVRLDKTMAREIMVPRVDIVAAELGVPLSRLVAQMVDSGHSRVPIFEESLDHIKGIAYSRDLLGLLSSGGNAPGTLTEDVIRPALFTPESKNLEELLNEFQETQVHMAIVVDEYGGVSGMVTIEDLLEEIVGEIHDEFDVGEPQIQPLEEGGYLMDAGVSIEQVNELLEVAVEADGFDTLGGLVYQRLGKIPGSGDLVEDGGVRIEVVSTVGRRIKRLRVAKSSGGIRTST